MKTLQEQYTLIKEGKGHKDVFLKEAKRLYPNLINKPATYNEATKILKNKGVLTENIMGVADLSPINSIESPKASWEEKFKNFINEAGEKSLNPIVNNDMKFNTREEDEKVPAVSKAKYSMDTNEAGSYKLSKGVENIASHNYDYSPKVDNINNVNVNELQNGVYCEAKNNPELTLEEIQAKVISNLAKDPLHYVKNGQFGVEGLGYSEQKVEESDGENYGGSGFSEKVKEGSSQMQIVKENLAGMSLVSSGNPTSLAAMSSQVIKTMLDEEGLAQGQVVKEDSMEDFEPQAPMVSQPVAEEDKEKDMPMDEKKDHDGDGDIDSDDYLAARDKAIKKAMGKKKPKKESIETKLAEIGKAGDITKMEAQLEFLTNHISEKEERVNSINEDENLKELVDKKKMKDMQKEIKLLEKRKAKMEKMYEKMSGQSFQMPQIVGEEENE